jgi:hypothetical protein
MPDQKYLEILNKGVGVWNAWRAKSPPDSYRSALAELASKHPMSSKTRQAIEGSADIKMIDLSGADLRGRDLARADFSSRAAYGCDGSGSAKACFKRNLGQGVA